MAIKGLVGKEGNTLGTSEKPWEAIYTNNLNGYFFFDYENPIELSFKSYSYKVNTSIQYVKLSDPISDTGLITVTASMASTGNGGIAIVKNDVSSFVSSISAQSFSDCIICYTSWIPLKSGDNVHSTFSTKGLRISFRSQAVDFNSLSAVLYPIKYFKA